MAAGSDAGVSIDQFERAMRSGDASAEGSRPIRCDVAQQHGLSVCARIAGGERPWLQLAVRLLDCTDAGAHGAICQSMTSAMRHAPAVLALLTKTPQATERCLCLPFVSDVQLKL